MINEFKEAFMKYDAFWAYSDDHRAWSAGRLSSYSLQALAGRCTQEELKEFLTLEVVQKVYGPNAKMSTAEAWIKQGKL